LDTYSGSLSLRRRDLFASGLALFAAPVVRAAQASTRAIDLVLQSNVIDMLGLLTLDWPLLARWQSAPEHFRDSDFRKLRDSGIDVFHPAVAFDGADTYALTRDWFGRWNRFIDAHPDYFFRVLGADDLGRARSEKKIGVILGMQDANHIRSVEDVDSFYATGQRLTQVTYNTVNRLGSGCMVAHDSGLTPFGAEVVARMNAVGMAVDVSHCGERTSLDAIEASTKPVLITHSNCRALANAPRCKSDVVIQAAARKGGVIGLTGVRHFVHTGDPVTIENALDHFDRASRVAGIEHVGVGSDLDLDGRDRGAGPLRYDIPGLNRVNRIFALTEGLIRRGYTDEHIRLILGGNFQRALKDIWS